MSENKSIRRLYLGCLFVVVAGLSIGVVLAAMLYGINSRANHAIEVEFTEIRKSGYPVTIPELRALYDLGDRGREAGQAMLDVLTRYVEPSNDSAEHILFVEFHLDHETTETEREISVTRQHLESNSRYLDGLHDVLSAFDEFEYPIVLADGFDIEFLHLSELRTATRMLAAQAYIDFHDGRNEDAIQSILCALQIVSSLDEEPTLVSQLARIGCMNICIDAIQELNDRFELSEDNLSILAQGVENLSVDGSMQLGLVSERCFMVDALTVPYKIPPWIENEFYESEFDDFIDGMPWRGAFMKHNLVKYLRWSERLIGIGDLPMERWIEESTELDSKVENDLAPHQLVAVMSMTSVMRVYGVEVRIGAIKSVAEFGLLAHRFQLQNGRVPSSLEELCTALGRDTPIDPFTNENLLYRTDEDYLYLYSVGHDQEDDGAIDTPEGVSVREDGDCVFRVPRINAVAN